MRVQPTASNCPSDIQAKEATPALRANLLTGTVKKRCIFKTEQNVQLHKYWNAAIDTVNQNDVRTLFRSC